MCFPEQFIPEVCEARTLILKYLMPEGIEVQKTRTHSAERSVLERQASWRRWRGNWSLHGEGISAGSGVWMASQVKVRT